MFKMEEITGKEHFSTFHAWYSSRVLPAWSTYVAIGLSGMFRVERSSAGPVNFKIILDHDVAARLDGNTQAFAAAYSTINNVADWWCVYLLGQIAMHGLKLFRPNQRDCEAMSHIEPRVPCTEYRQPFDTLVVEFPADYAIKCAVQGEDIMGRPRQVYPLAVVSHIDYSRQIICLVVILQSGQGLTLSMNMATDMSVEEAIRQLKGKADGANCLPSTAEEDELRDLAVRVAVNANLLLTHYGCRRLGTTNDNHEARLKQRVARGGPHQQQNRLALAQLPVLYGFEQHVTLYDSRREQHALAEAGAGGWTVKPHWRRGHFQMQVCGTGGKDRVRQFRRAVLVNEHLFAGDESTTTVKIDKH